MIMVAATIMSLVSGESSAFLSHDASHWHAAVWQTSFQLVFNFSENSAIINSHQLVFNFNENWSSVSHEWSPYYARLSRCQAFMMLKLSPYMLLINRKLDCLQTLEVLKKRSGMWIFLEQFNKGRVSYMQGSHAVSLKISVSVSEGTDFGQFFFETMGLLVYGLNH